MKDEFYIGYNGKMPTGIARFIKGMVIVMFTSIMGLGVYLSVNQRGFMGSTYEYYQQTELTGLIIVDPIPAIQVYWGQDQQDNPIIQTIPIVAFGKIGGAWLIKDFENTWVTLKGNLIYYNGKSLLEVTRSDTIVQAEAEFSQPPPTRIRYGKTSSFKGEIVDAKCYFGVMKPGHNKPHRSCAIRCIAGGIPAVLRSESENGTTDYHLIISQKELSKYVGELIEITGAEGSFDDWKVLKIDSMKPLSSIDHLDNAQDRGIALCWE